MNSCYFLLCNSNSSGYTVKIVKVNKTAFLLPVQYMLSAVFDVGSRPLQERLLSWVVKSIESF